MNATKWVLGAAAGYSVATMAFALAAIAPKRLSYEEILQKEIRKNQMDPQLFHLPYKEERCSSQTGETLFGRMYYAKTHSNSYVLFLHGYNVPWLSGLKYIPLLHRLGFHVLLVDQPAQGKSEGRFITFGGKEAGAAILWLDWLRKKAAGQAKIGVMGESMGAATALIAAAQQGSADFCIADCSYTSWWEQLTYWGKQRYHLPTRLLMPGVAFWCKQFTGVDMKEVSPLKAAKQLCCPTLVLHGSKDQLVPAEMAQRIAAQNSRILLHIIDGARHANAIAHAPEEYARVVEAFLDSCNALPIKKKKQEAPAGDNGDLLAGVQG